MATTAEIIAKVAQFIAASDKSYQIVNGPATGEGSMVPVASGIVPTHARQAQTYASLVMRGRFSSVFALEITFPPTGYVGLARIYDVGEDLPGGFNSFVYDAALPMWAVGPGYVYSIIPMPHPMSPSTIAWAIVDPLNNDYAYFQGNDIIFHDIMETAPWEELFSLHCMRNDATTFDTPAIPPQVVPYTADDIIASTAGAVLTTGNQTIGGTKTFSGLTVMNGQAGSTALNRAYTLGDVVTLVTGMFVWPLEATSWSSTVYASGSFSNVVGVLSINAAAEAGSGAVVHSDGNQWRTWGRGFGIAVDWSRRVTHSTKICSDSFAGADTVIRLQLGMPANTVTLADILSSHKAIGFKIIAGLIYAQVANGSAVTTTTTGVTMSALSTYDLTITSNGDGTWEARVNGTIITGSGAPTGSGTNHHRACNLSITNGTTAATRRFAIMAMKTLQF